MDDDRLALGPADALAPAAAYPAASVAASIAGAGPPPPALPDAVPHEWASSPATTPPVGTTPPAGTTPPVGTTPPAGPDPSPVASWPVSPPARRSGPRRRTLLAWFALVLALVVVFSAGMSVGRSALAAPAATPGADPSFAPGAVPDWRLLDEAYKLLQQHYVDPAALDPLTLERGAVSGMTDALNDRGHTAYLTPDQTKARDEELSGTFVGVGAVLDDKDGRMVVVRVLPDSPAQRAGLLAGDQIVRVDGASIDGLTIDQVVQKVRGPAGTQVTLELKGVDGTIRSLTITRQKLILPLSSWAFAPGTHDAVIRLESFSSGAAKAFKSNLQAALDGGAEGIVLDLRANPGGYVPEAVSVASQFLSDGVVFRSVDRTGTEKENRVEPGGIATKIPLVVLVDDQTASSAEIVTGALQDAGRGRVVGVQTYGTGTVVSTYPMSDGGAMAIGTERWLTPKGRAIWREGLVPDEVVALPTGATLVVPDDFSSLGPAGIAGTQDVQLKAAIAALDREEQGGGSQSGGGWTQGRGLDRAA